MVLPTWIAGMLIFGLSFPFHDAEERHGIQQDTQLAIPSGKSGPYRYEWKVTRVLREEVLEKLAEFDAGN